MKESLKRFWIYSLCYLAIFNFIFLPRFAADSQTMGMFIIISVILQFLTFILFHLAIAGLSYLGISVKAFAKAVILFLIAQISIFIVSGDIPLFGLLIISPTNVSESLQSNLLAFRKSRDFALSMSGLISTVVYFVATMTRRKIEDQGLTP